MLEGMAFNQAPACGRAEERAKALDLYSVWGNVEQLLVSCIINTAGERMLSARNVNLLEGAPIRSLGGVSQG